MGVVYEAEDDLLKKTVAIKTLRKGILTAEHIIRFQREANALAALNHPNLVPIYIFGITDDNEPYLVMQYEPGKPLSEVIESRGRLPAYKSLSIFVQLCDAIQHAHEHGVLHRDLKPDNVILRNPESEHPQVVIIDFGIAMMETNAIDDLTKTGSMLGTPAYMSPEQVLGKTPDERSDIYALGCIMFETLTGTKPFSAASALEMLAYKTSNSAPFLNSTSPDLTFPTGLEVIVAKCLATSPAERYQTVADLKLDLIGFKSGDYQFESDAVPPLNVNREGPAIKKRHKKNQLALVVYAIVTIAICMLAALALNRIQGSTGSNDLFDKPIDDTLIKTPPKGGSVRGNCLYLGDIISEYSGCDDASAAIDLKKFGDKIIKVDMIDTKITGTCFRKFSSLPIVQLISSDSEISDEGLDAISKIQALQILELKNETSFTARGLLNLLAARKMYDFTALNCKIDREKTEAICALKQVLELSVEGNSDFKDEELKMVVKAMPQLRFLNVSATGVSIAGLRELDGLKKLDKLRARNLNLTGNEIEVLSKLSNLKSLDVKENDSLKSADLDYISRMKSLKQLEVNSKSVTKEAKTRLKERNRLKINDEEDLAKEIAR